MYIVGPAEVAAAEKVYTGPRIDKVGALQGVNKQQKYDRCSYFTAPLLTGIVDQDIDE